MDATSRLGPWTIPLQAKYAADRLEAQTMILMGPGVLVCVCTFVVEVVIKACTLRLSWVTWNTEEKCTASSPRDKNIECFLPPS